MSNIAPCGGVDWRHALSGTLPAPLVSSAALEWPDIRVEIFRQRAMDVVTQASAHVISVQLAGTRHLYQQRNGRVASRLLHPGAVVITPAGEPKHWRHVEPVEVLVIQLATGVVEQVAEAVAEGRRGRPEVRDDFGTSDPVIEHLAGHLADAARTPDGFSRLFAQTAAYQLAIRLLQRHADKAAPLAAVKLTRRKLRAAIDYIEAHLEHDLTLGAIAQSVALSPCHFAHAFKLETGVSPYHYVVTRRIDRAKRLLRETRLNVAEVGYRVGYGNHSHFCVAFQRITGATPSAYRAGA